MEDLAELMQRLLEIQSGGRQRSPELIAEDERLMDGLRKEIWQESPHKKMPRSHHCGNRGKVEAESPPWRNNLDATKNYGYPAREAGRYGSHPSHDVFDGESKP